MILDNKSFRRYNAKVYLSNGALKLKKKHRTLIMAGRQTHISQYQTITKTKKGRVRNYPESSL